MNKTEATLSASGKRFVILASRWNEFVTKQLVEGAARAIKMHGGGEAEQVWVSGAWEMPIAAQYLARSRPAGIVAVGCILQGATAHASQLSNQLAASLCDVSLKAGVPITWGVLTCADQSEAIERAGMKLGNKGEEAAIAAIDLASVIGKVNL